MDEQVIDWSQGRNQKWGDKMETHKYAKGGACEDDGEGLDLEACPYFC